MSEFDDFDSYEADGDFDQFDSSDDSSPYNAEAGQDETIDAVADLISGRGSEKADRISERGFDGKDRGLSSHSVDSHGRATFDSHKSGEESAYQQPQQKHETIYGHQVEQAKSHARSEWQAAHAENDRLQREYEEGRLDAQSLFQLQYEQGVRANAAKEAMMMGEIMELRHAQQLKETHAALEQVMGDAWAPHNRKQTQQEILEWTQKHNITNETMAGITTEAEMLAIWNAFKNEKELTNTKLELQAAKQMLKKQSRELRGRQQRSAKSNNIGMKDRDTNDKVVDILNSAMAAKRGGRR